MSTKIISPVARPANISPSRLTSQEITGCPKKNSHIFSSLRVVVPQIAQTRAQPSHPAVMIVLLYRSVGSQSMRWTESRGRSASRSTLITEQDIIENRLYSFKQINKKYSMLTDQPVGHAPVPYRHGTNKPNIAFAIALFLDQALVCLLYGLIYNFDSNISNTPIFDEYVLVGLMTLMVIVGFGLLNSYITNSSFSGMSMTLLIFVLSVEHFFLVKTFWEKAGTGRADSFKTWRPQGSDKISLVNTGNDRFVDSIISHYSYVDAIACALANVVAFASLAGRIQLLEALLLSLIGTFLYEVNSELLWKLEITDTGYGMRVFLWGGFYGLISSCILGKRRIKSTAFHERYFSIYATRALGLVGLIIIFCTFPTLVVASLYQTSNNNSYIINVAAFNMFLALVAGVLGSFTISALTYKKIFVFDLIFSGINGGIIYSSSADIHPNPTVPLTAGFVGGMISTAYHSRQLRNMNYKGVLSSLGHLDNYVLPGLFSAIVAAILHATGEGSYGDYVRNIGVNGKGESRSFVGQGGYEIIGLLLSSGIGIFAGVVLGLLMLGANSFVREDEFTDDKIYQGDRKVE